MHLFEIPGWRRKIIPVTLATALAFGGLILFFSNSVDSAFAGAGVVLVIGFFRNAYFAIEEDTIGGVQFPLSQCFEFFLAFALVVWEFPIIGSINLLGESYPNAVVFMVFYGFKLLLTFYFMARPVELSEKGGLVWPAYLLLVAISVLALEWPDSRSMFPDCTPLYWLLAWFPVPTVTLFCDMRKEYQPSVRFAVWRSTIEILFVCPLFCFFAICLITVVAIVAQEIGRLDFRLPRSPTPSPPFTQTSHIGITQIETADLSNCKIVLRIPNITGYSRVHSLAPYCKLFE